MAAVPPVVIPCPGCGAEVRIPLTASIERGGYQRPGHVTVRVHAQAVPHACPTAEGSSAQTRFGGGRPRG